MKFNQFIRRGVALGMAACVLIVSGCTSSPQPAVDRSTFAAYLPDNPKGFDPASISDVLSIKVGAQLYKGLVSLDERGQLQPALAESWSTEDGRIWTFRLRPGTRFCDDPAFPGGRGRGLTADDVKFSLERIVQKRQASPASWIFLDLVEGAREYYDEKRPDVSGFVVRDPQTFEIRLNQPHFAFIHRLATNYGWVVAPEAVRSYGGDLPTHPVGAGEFCLVSRSLDQEVVLRRKETSASGISTLRFRVIKDPVLASQQFTQGALNEYEPVVEQLPQILDAGALKPEYRQFQWINEPGLNWYFVGLNMSDPVIGGGREQSRLLRQALQKAINTDVLTRQILFGGAEPLRRIFQPAAGVANAELPQLKFDRQEAASLLARAGYPEGRGLAKIHFIILNTDEAKAVAEQIKSDWAAIGVQSEYEQRDFPTLVDLVIKGKSPVTSLFIDAISLSPDYAVQFFLPSSPFNFFGYKNPELGLLYEKALRTADEGERNGVYARMENLILNDAPWLLLYSRNKSILLQQNVRGYRMNALRQVDYSGVSLE